MCSAIWIQWKSKILSAMKWLRIDLHFVNSVPESIFRWTNPSTSNTRDVAVLYLNQWNTASHFKDSCFQFTRKSTICLHFGVVIVMAAANIYIHPKNETIPFFFFSWLAFSVTFTHLRFVRTNFDYCVCVCVLFLQPQIQPDQTIAC